MWVWNLGVTVREEQDSEKNTVPNREKVTGDWRKVHNEELHGLHSSPNIIRVVKSRKKRWAEHVACVGEKKN
jgi:hypothetical protein